MALPHLTRRSYFGALQNGRYPYTMAPRTSWRQTVRASDLATTAATTTVLGTVGAIADGDFVLDFHDRDGVLLAQATVGVGGGSPADEAELAAELAGEITSAAGPGGGLEDLLDSATSDAEDFAIVFVPGANITVSVNDEPVASITLEHQAAVDLNALANGRNPFLVDTCREADPYVIVTEAWAASTTVSIEDDGVASSDVLVDAPLDALGYAQGGSSSTLGETDKTEQAWSPVAILALGDDPAPTAGAFEVVVPFSPLPRPA